MPQDTADRATVALGDADLVLQTRAGDADAFAELWRRHYRAGTAVARSVTSSLDPDDLVQESFTRIYQSIQAGGGPTGSFRAYLFTSIRNTAATWGRARQETALDVLDTIEDPATSEQATAEALDRSLTNQAFRSLPTRWQEVLWYTEIEQMKPAEVGPLLGMKASAVAQLAFRAREGLREAWVQAHLTHVADGSDCQWTIERLGAYARANTSRRDRAKIDAHLERCARCTIVAGEAHEVSDRLALVLLPLTVGLAGTAGYLAALQGGGMPVTAIAAMPAGTAAGAASAPPPGGAEAATAAAPGAGGASTASIGTIAGLVAATVVVVGGIVAGAAMLSPGGSDDAGPAEQAAALGIDSRLDMPLTVPDPMTPDAPVADEDAPVSPNAATDPAVDAPESTTDAVSDPPPSSDASPGDGEEETASPAAPPATPEPPVDPGAPDDTSALPSGAPVIVGSTSSTTAGDTVAIDIDLEGEPGATVRARIRGAEVARTTLDETGAGSITVMSTAEEVAVGTRLELRYVAGAAEGSPTGAKLRDLV